MSETYVDRLLATLAGNPDREALIDGRLRLSYAEARTRILQLAATFDDLGLRRGEGVAIYSGNRAEVVLVQLAVHLIGCHLVFVPPERTLREQLSYLRRTAPAVFIFDPAISKAGDLAATPASWAVLTIGPGDIGDDLLALAERQPSTEPAWRAGRDDVASLFYAGGLGGRAEVLLHRHSYYDGLIYAGDHRRAECPTPQRFLVCTLINHSGGHSGVVTGLLAGGTVVLLPEFDAGVVIAAMLQERITSVMLQPPLLDEVLDHPDFPPDGFPDLVRLQPGPTPRVRGSVDRFERCVPRDREVAGSPR
jgi:fatty-acyl-CoA synthase